MKNQLVLADPAVAVQEINTLWKTDAMRTAAQDPESVVHRMVAEATRLPLVLFDYTNPEIEKSHPSTWWRYLARRQYERAGVHDAYLIGELASLAFMTYEPQVSFTQWFRKISEVRYEASVLSEAEIYFAVPGLRERSFEFEIWVDRYLTEAEPLPGRKPRDESNTEFFQRRPATASSMLRANYREVVHRPDPFDFLELQIASFAQQNLRLAHIWSRQFRRIESMLASFVATCSVDRQMAIDGLVGWLSDTVITVPTLDIPFEHEAQLIADQYRQHLLTYGNEKLRL